MTLKANILMLMILIFRIAVAQETGSITDSRDNHIYRIVKIGKQWWMAENLNYLIKTDPGCYAKKLSNCFKYGRLYTWNTAMNGDSSSNTNPSGVKGICPLGWHLPSDAEWMELEKSLGMTSEEANSSGFRGSDVGNKLKEADTFHWKNQNINVTNSIGFTAMP